MKDMKAKMAAIDELIGLCEDAIAHPAKAKRMTAVVVKPETEAEEMDEQMEGEDVFDKKAKLSNMLDEMDEDELMELYSKLEG